MIDHVKTVGDSILIMTGVLSTLKVDSKRMQASLTPDMLATDLAEYLVRSMSSPL
jgi:argininosuccinate lyase